MIIQSKLGPREVDDDKIIYFPRGLIGFDTLRYFTLLQIREESPFLVLQSTEQATLGLLVADPFSFLPDYSLVIGDAEQAVLQVDSAAELAVLVTASIPPGKIEETSLNLVGPILINHGACIGLQVPQTSGKNVSRVYVYQQKTEKEE